MKKGFGITVILVLLLIGAIFAIVAAPAGDVVTVPAVSDKVTAPDPNFDPAKLQKGQEALEEFLNQK